MRFPQYKYVDVAYGSVANRNNIKILPKLDIPKNTSDCYRTVYRYPEEFLLYCTNTGSVKGYAGYVYADYLPIDVDSDNLSEAHESAKKVLNNLLNNYEVDLDQLRLFFSGAKGFHIMIPAVLLTLSPSKEMPQAFKIIVPTIAEGTKIDTTIYDRVRLFRLSNTINSKTGLHKIPLTAAEMLHKTIEEIKDLAKTPRQVEAEGVDKPNEYLSTLYRRTITALKAPRGEIVSDSPKMKPPKNAKLCYYKIMEGLSEGNRDNAGLRLAVHLLKEFPGDMVLPMLNAWNKKNSPPMDNESVEKLFKQAQEHYDFGCKDSVLSEYCDSSCIYKGREQAGRVTADRIYTIDEAKNRYLEYIAKLDQRKILLGFRKIDYHLRGIAPGEVCEVIARTGVGKTAFLLNVINKVIVNQKIPVLFFSLEQPLAQIYERTVQISNEISGAAVEKDYKDPEGLKFSHSIVDKNYKDLYVVEEDFLTYEELRDFIKLAETEKIHQRPPLVCIDYLGRMKGSKGDAYEATSELARLLKALAKELDIAILYLHQTSRSGKTGAEPISFDMGRESGVTEEAADFIIGLWRPQMNDPQVQEKSSEEMIIALLKNRKGSLGQGSYRFAKQYLRIEEWE